MTRSSFLFLVALFAANASNAVRGGSLFFKRGDANVDGVFNISDAAHTLRFLFFGRPASLGCQDAADSNDDGTVDISDASEACRSARPFPLALPTRRQSPSPPEPK